MITVCEDSGGVETGVLSEEDIPEGENEVVASVLEVDTPETLPPDGEDTWLTRVLGEEVRCPRRPRDKLMSMKGGGGVETWRDVAGDISWLVVAVNDTDGESIAVVPPLNEADGDVLRQDGPGHKPSSNPNDRLTSISGGSVLAVVDELTAIEGAMAVVVRLVIEA